jgi:hypothetical protein
VGSNTQSFAASVTDSLGNSLNAATTTWSIIGTNCGSVPTGAGATKTYTAPTSPKTCTLRATNGSVSSDATITITAGALHHITISAPLNRTLNQNQNSDFVARAYDSLNNELTSESINWSVSGGNGAFSPATSTSGQTVTFDPNTIAGTFTILAAGASNTTITHTATVTVNVGAINSVTVTPASRTTSVNGSTTFTASMFDSSGNPVPGNLIWSVSGGNGSFSPNPTAGGATVTFNAGTIAGTFTITATSIASPTRRGTATVTINPGALNNVIINPTSRVVEQDNATTFIATLRDIFNNPLSGNINWSVSGGNGTFSPNQTASGASVTFNAGTIAGTFTITARSATNSSILDTATVTVNLGSLNRIDLTPTSRTTSVNGTTTFIATAYDSNNNVLPSEQIDWNVSGNAGTFSTNQTTSGNTVTFNAGTLAGTFVVTASSAIDSDIFDTSTVTINPGALDTIVVSPTGATLAPNGTQTFSAQGFDAFGNLRASDTFTWSLSTSVVGSFTTGTSNRTSVGFQAGTTAGTYTNSIRATRSGITGTANVVVTSASLDRIEISPNSVTLSPNQLQTFSVTGYDAFNNVVSPIAVGWSVVGAGTIQSSGPATVTVKAGTTAGSYSNGLQATTSGKSATASITINASGLASLRITPSSVTLQPNATQNFTVRGYDAFNNEVSVGSFTWANPPGAGTFEGSLSSTTVTYRAGTTAGIFGNAVRVQSGSITGNATVTISPSALARLTVTPISATIPAGQSQQFTVTGYDQYNNVISNPSVTWSVNGSAGTIESNGLFNAGTGVGNFPNAIQARNGSITGVAGVNIVSSNVNRIDVTPNVATLGANSTVSFNATAYDEFNNVIPNINFVWSASAGGVIESSSGGTAVFKATNTPGTYNNAVRARFGSVNGYASVVVVPVTVQALASPAEIRTDGNSPSNIIVTIIDAAGNPVGAGTAVVISVVSCPGTCVISPESGVTDPQGRFVSSIRMAYTSPTQTLSSNIVLNINAVGVGQRSVTIAGQFKPISFALPLISRSYPPNNHTACDYLPLNVPDTVSQPANNPFNIYRFTATSSSHIVRTTNYGTTGQLLLYRIKMDACSINGTISLEYLGAQPMSQVAVNQNTLVGLVAGQSYLFAINTTGPLVSASYQMRLE